MRTLSPLIAAAALMSAAGCRQAANETAANNLPEANAPTEARDTPAPLPTVEAPLTRRDLLLATIEAASAAATRVDDTEQQRALDGHPFRMRLRLCDSDPLLRQEFDPASRVLKVSVAPDLNVSTTMPAGNDGGGVSGFWIPRPWMLTAACPAKPAASSNTDPASAPPSAATGAPVAPARTVGLVQIVRPDEQRQAGKPRPYAITRRLGDTEQPGPIDLVIEGRLRASDARVIRCTGLGDMAAPSCLVSVTMDRVRLEDATGSQLGEWSDG